MTDGVRLEDTLIEFVLEHGDDLHFTKWFWKGCEPLPNDKTRYEKFAEVLRLGSQGASTSEIGRRLGVNHNSIYEWMALRQMPKLGHFLKAYLRLGCPRSDLVWLTLEQTRGYAIPIGQFVQVPTSVGRWDDVGGVLSQIRPLGEKPTTFNRHYLFGFLLGIVLGDGHKPKQGNAHRHLSLVLSKKYGTNVRIGGFTCYCANQCGLRMERSKDKPKPANKPHGFFEWISQASPFLDWMFNACLGLKDGQNTTYDHVAMDWAIEAPRDFRLGLIQGIAESDGSVSISSQAVEFWVLPDHDFIIRLLATFGLHGFRNREAVSIVKSQAINSFQVPVFAEHLQTVRYQRLKLMATARKLARIERLPTEIRQEIIQLAAHGRSVPGIVEDIARIHRLLISFEAAQRWARKSNHVVQPSQETQTITTE